MKELIASQIFDSAFANGAYSHSFGLESFIRLDLVRDEESFLRWLECYLRENFVFQDALGFLLSHRAFKSSNLKGEICMIDEALSVCNLSREVRLANRHIALSSLASLEIFEFSSLKIYSNLISQNSCFGHSAIVFGLACAQAGLSESSLLLYAFSSVKNLSASATRAIPLGQKSTQKILKNSHILIDEIYEKAKTLDPELLGCGSSVLELSCFLHEGLDFRLFMS